ncbi:glycosyltransferase family 4 protein [candidate division WOR-3 bacterium]|nr:glycosyltransferase family 4 protein [candidate division WOR-3 bacterium]
MKIVQIITKLEKGGAQLTVLEILKNKKNSVLITGRGGLLMSSARKEYPGRVFVARSLAREINPAEDICAFWQILKTVKKIKSEFDCIVHTNSSKAGLLGRWACLLLSVPCVHTVHGWSFNPRQNPFFLGMAVLFEKLTSLFTSRLVVVTKEDIKKGMGYKIGKPEKYAVARAVTDLTPFRILCDRSLKRKLGFPENCIIVGSISNFKPQKAPLDFVKTAGIVLKKRPDSFFFIAGGGPLFSESKKLASQLDIADKLKFLGWRNDVPQLMSSLDIFLLVSLWEGLPQVVLQAMAAGKPVVVTAVDGSKEIVRNGTNGFLTEPGNPEDSADKIIKLIDDATQRVKMGKEGNKTVSEGFTVDEMMKALERVWSEAKSPLEEIKISLFGKL